MSAEFLFSGQNTGGFANLPCSVVDVTGRPGDLVHAGADLAYPLRCRLHIHRHLSGDRRLLLDGRGDHAGNVVNLADRCGDLLDPIVVQALP